MSRCGLEGRPRVALLDGNASPMSPRSCCKNVASHFVVLSYYTGNSGFRKAGDLGFEPRLTDPESVVLPLHQSPKLASRWVRRFSLHRSPNYTVCTRPVGFCLRIPPRSPHLPDRAALAVTAADPASACSRRPY